MYSVSDHITYTIWGSEKHLWNCLTCPSVVGIARQQIRMEAKHKVPIQSTAGAIPLKNEKGMYAFGQKFTCHKTILQHAILFRGWNISAVWLEFSYFYRASLHGKGQGQPLCSWQEVTRRLILVNWPYSSIGILDHFLDFFSPCFSFSLADPSLLRTPVMMRKM